MAPAWRYDRSEPRFSSFEATSPGSLSRFYVAIVCAMSPLGDRQGPVDSIDTHDLEVAQRGKRLRFTRSLNIFGPPELGDVSLVSAPKLVYGLTSGQTPHAAAETREFAIHEPARESRNHFRPKFPAGVTGHLVPRSAARRG